MDDDGGRPRSGTSTLEQLIEVLDVAARLTDVLAGDPALQRVFDAFRVMPMEDRTVIARVIEREVQARRLSLATETVTGQSMHPNPHARLYLRSHQKTVPRLRPERDELMLSMLAAMRLTPILLVPDIHTAWLDGTRDALEHLEPSASGATAQLLREMLEIVESAAVDGPTKRAS